MVQGMIIFVCMSFLMLFIGCTNTNNGLGQSVGKELEKSNSIFPKIPSDVCSSLAGNWGAFEIPQGVEKQMCGDLPCGYVGPFKLSCDEGIISGSVLLSVDSKTGKDYRSPISANWEEGRLTLKYTNNQQCLITYKVLIKDSDLVGEYIKENCGEKNVQGNVIAKKNPSLRLKEKP